MKQLTQILIVLAAFVLSIGMVAGVHAVSKLGEDELIRYVVMPQGSLKNFESADAVWEFLAKKEEAFVNSPIEFQSDRGNLTLTPADIGITLQHEVMKQEFEKVAQEGTPFEKAKLFVFGRMHSPFESEPGVGFQTDDTMLHSAFTSIETLMDNAHFVLKDGNLTVNPEKEGYQIDTSPFYTTLARSWEEDFSAPAVVTLPMTTVKPTRTQAELEARLPEAEVLADKKFTLQDDRGQTWTVALADHMDWVDLGDGDQFTIKPEALEPYLVEFISPSVETVVQEAAITQDKAGVIQFEGSARFGKTINREMLIEEFEARLVADDGSKIMIPLDIEKPKVTISQELQDRGIKELVGVGYSNFTGSSNDRIHNVIRGMQQFHGSIIPQGETFSFTTLMGPIDAANGWKSELVILGDKTEKQYGGGLCQVSSTMFRAALLAGLPIDSRINHSYWVTYYGAPYGPGLDATVYDPNPNLKFTNDTPGDILIQGYTDGLDAYFVFYGTSDDRRVTLEGPFAYDYRSISEPKITFVENLAPGERKLQEYGHTGFKVDWYRTVFKADGTSAREQIHSNYEARPAKYFEGQAEGI